VVSRVSVFVRRSEIALSSGLLRVVQDFHIVRMEVSTDSEVPGVHTMTYAVFSITPTLLFAIVATVAPPIRIDPPRIELGDHRSGEKIAIQCSAINQTSTPVRIKAVIGSCSCLTAEPEALIIPPDGRVSIRVVVDSLGRQGDFRSRVVVLTDIPDNPVQRVDVVGRFHVDNTQLTASPWTIYLGAVGISSRTSQVVQIERSGRTPVGDLHVTSSANWIRWQVRHVSDEKLLLIVTASLAKDEHAVAKQIAEEILLQGADPNDVLRIPVRGEILPPVWVSPEIVLVSEKCRKYLLSVETYNGSTPKLRDHIFESGELRLLSLASSDERIDHIVVCVERNPSSEGFAEGMLTLLYEDCSQPVRVLFVCPPLERHLSSGSLWNTGEYRGRTLNTGEYRGRTLFCVSFLRRIP